MRRPMAQTYGGAGGISAAIAMMTDDKLQAWLDHVSSLTPKQQRRWRDIIKDGRGVARRVFHDGCFNINAAGGILVAGGHRCCVA